MGAKSDKLPPLTDDQKSFLVLNWEKLNLNDLVKQCYKDESLNGHSAQALLVKEYLVSLVGPDTVKAKLRTTKFVKGEDIVLTPENITFIENNYKVMKVAEITNLLFNKEGKKKLTPLNKEYRVVYDYVQKLAPDHIPKDEQLAEEGEYNPPQSIARLVPRVNKYIIKGDPAKKFLDAQNLTQQQTKHLTALMGYMNNYRFCYQMSQYRSKVDRELFEASYIEFLYSKPEEIEENVHNYISLCTEIVNISSMERTIQLINEKYYDILSGNSDEKMSVTLAETLDKMRAKQSDSKKKYGDLMGDLVGKREKKEGAKLANNATFLNLVEAVQQEKTRKELLIIAEKQKELEAMEVDTLSDMDGVIALIAGANKDKLKYG